MAVIAIVSKQGEDGTWEVVYHHDQTAELRHRADQQCWYYVHRSPLYVVRRKLAEMGIGEEDWTPR